MKFTVALLSFLVGFSSYAEVVRGPERDAQIKNLFNVIKKTSKGALGLNAYQTSDGRIIVMQNGVILSPPKNNLLTVAFRNETAEQLANIDFFVGNRFGSNYWTLHNTFQATPEEQAAKAFNINPIALRQKPEAKALAVSMARHQMLELYYMQNSANSSLTKSYNQRGVADADHELKYYRLYAEYLAYNLQDANDFMFLVEFQKRSGMIPGKKTVSLSVIRQTVSDLSAKLDMTMAQDKAMEFRKLRNSIHNGMNQTVVTQLTTFKEQNQSVMLPEDITMLDQLIGMITAYYTIDKEALSVLGSKVQQDLPQFSKVLANVESSNNGLNALAQLAELAKDARLKFETSRNIDLIHLIIRLQDFVQADLGRLNLSSAPDLIQQAKILSMLAYSSGYFTEGTLSELSSLLNADPSQAVGLLSRLLSDGVSRFQEIFEPAITDWKLVSTSVQSFVDDGIRSSVLITIDSTVTSLKKYYPPAGPSTADFAIENNGVGYGYLTFVPREKTDQMVSSLTYKMIPVFEALPLDLGVVAAVITEEPQTPLSHVNIKSKNRGTPNVYIKKASQDPRVKNLLARKALVRLELSQGVMALREVNLAEAEAFWSAKTGNRPAIQLRADLNEKRIRPSSEIGFNDVVSVGAKAANYSEANHILPEAVRPGFAIPFYYYREFMQTNKFDATQTLEQYVQNLMNNPQAKTNRQFLVDSLKALQDRIKAKDMVVNQGLVAELKSKINQAFPNARMRFRSSTNSEDLPQFTGAGLYDSAAYDPAKPKKTVENALQEVWSSVWNLRAFDERELFKMNHLEVYMAILVSPAFPDELANGVGVGRNIINKEDGPGLYLNIQQGSEAVTNPNPDLTPDQVLVLFKPDPVAKTKYTLKYLKYSSFTKTQPVLPYAEVEKITDILRALQNHFYPLYHPKKDNPKFALDVEFKVDLVDGKRQVHFKQARPFIGE